MKILDNVLKTQLNLQIIPKYIPIIILLFAIIGFSDATFLTVKHYQNVIPPCTIGGCESVLSSSYAKIFGIPVALMGAIYYLAILFSVFIFLDTKKEKYLRFPMMISFIGLLSAIWFSFLQLFIIKAFCPYCVVSAISSTAIFITAVYSIRKYKLNEIN